MLSILKNLQRVNKKSLATAFGSSANNLLRDSYSQTFQHQTRAFYPEFYVKRDRFDKIYNKFKADKSIQVDSLRKELSRQRLPLNQAFYDNLKVFIYLASDEKDLDMLLRCFHEFSHVKQFQEQTVSVLFIRKLVAMDRLDFATDVFLNRNNSFNFMNQISSAVALVDSLMDKRKYGQVIRVFEEKFLLTGAVIPRIIFFAVSLSLLKKADSEAFAKMQKYIDHMHTKGFHLGIGSIVHVFFLALQLGHIEYGLKFLSQTSRVHRSLYCNLLIMGLLDLHQTDAALEYCRKLLQIQVAEVSEYRSTDSIDGKFFRTTLDHLEKAVNKSKTESTKAEYQQMADKLHTSRIIEADIIKYFENPSMGVDRKDVRETHRF